MGQAISSLLKKKFFIRFVSTLIMAPVSLYLVYMGGYYFIGLTALIFLFGVYEWGKLSTKTTKPALFIVFGFLYFMLCYGSFVHMRLADDGLIIIFKLFLLVWSCDIGAYLVGKYFGRTKCAPNISPNKTWAGVAGGVLFAIICSNIYGFYLNNDMFEIWNTTLVAVVIAFASMLGDIGMSYAKRSANIKDTGNIIPGHGGVLDRIDSLMFASPIMAYFVYWGLV